MRTAHGDGTAVRWVYGVFLILCVALAVLVHHETPGTAMTSMPTPVNAAHTAHAGADGMTPSASQPSASQPSAHGVGSDACCTSSLQHCTTASVDSVQIAAPGQSGFQPLADVHRAVTEREPAGTVGRAPPDLSVLSQLRI